MASFMRSIHLILNVTAEPNAKMFIISRSLKRTSYNKILHELGIKNKYRATYAYISKHRHLFISNASNISFLLYQIHSNIFLMYLSINFMYSFDIAQICMFLFNIKYQDVWRAYNTSNRPMYLLPNGNRVNKKHNWIFSASMIFGACVIGARARSDDYICRYSCFGMNGPLVETHIIRHLFSTGRSRPYVVYL